MILERQDKKDLSTMLKHFKDLSNLSLSEQKSKQFNRFYDVLKMVYDCHDDINCPKCGCTELLCGYKS